MEGKTILVISPEAWGSNFVSKHHYANYLAQKNNVYFLNPASGFSKNPLGTIKGQLTEIKPNLTVIDYINLLPRLNNLPKSVQKNTYKRQAKQILNLINAKVDLVWSFDPFRYFDQAVWTNCKTIYHTVDFHPDAQFEKDIVLSSDAFFGVTEWILKDHNAYRKGIKIVHAADLDGFKNKTTPQLPGVNKIRACYVGNLHKHIDYGLLLDMVKTHPNVDFIIIGPIENSNLSAGNKVKTETLNALKTNPNIHFIGSVPPPELMGYISACDINLVLFQKAHEKIHCSPHKLMGYFYSGNITLSNYIDAHKNTDPSIIKMIPEQKDIPAAFSQIIENLSEHNAADIRAKRTAFAKANGYASKIEKIGQIVFNDAKKDI